MVTNSTEKSMFEIPATLEDEQRSKEISEPVVRKKSAKKESKERTSEKKPRAKKTKSPSKKAAQYKPLNIQNIWRPHEDEHP